MTGVIESLLTNPVTLNTSDDRRATLRHVYEELTYHQKDKVEPDLASPYLKASHVTTVPAHTNTITSGNFTMTVNFPNYGVAVTTANIAFDAEEAAIQTAVDNALGSETIVESYTNGDVAVALTGNLTANDATLTANGTSVNGAYMLVSTTNVDLDADKLATPVAATAGTKDRPAEATLALYEIVKPSGTVPYQGEAATASQYVLGGNPFSFAPATIKALMEEVIYNENETIGEAIKEAVGVL